MVAHLPWAHTRPLQSLSLIPTTSNKHKNLGYLLFAQAKLQRLESNGFCHSFGTAHRRKCPPVRTARSYRKKNLGRSSLPGRLRWRGPARTHPRQCDIRTAGVVQIIPAFCLLLELSSGRTAHLCVRAFAKPEHSGGRNPSSDLALYAMALAVSTREFSEIRPERFCCLFTVMTRVPTPLKAARPKIARVQLRDRKTGSRATANLPQRQWERCDAILQLRPLPRTADGAKREARG